jgi:deoxycytidylate deaminase
MTNQRLKLLDYPNSELVLGLIYPVGTDVKRFLDALSDHLEKFGYVQEEIRLSNFLYRINHGVAISKKPEEKRIDSLMTAGNKVREMTGGGDALALYAVSKIYESRLGDHPLNKQPTARKAYVLRSLKHPDEVAALRRIYGPGFFLIGLYAPQEQRLEYLINDKNIPKIRAEELIKRDQDEEEPSGLGQHVRDTFHLADVFINLSEPREAKAQLWRFLDLIFGDPFQTPTLDEHAMFLAFATSYRSGDLSRQVGAVVTSESGEIVAVGANDVPQFGGGLYWPGDDDRRDHVRGVDSNAERRDRILNDISGMLGKVLRKLGKQVAEAELLQEVKNHLSDSILFDITEFGRPVHAEMEALLACARSGVSPRQGTLYTTTFPCHNCAKHIVASGIRRVVYVEPYPKSQAGQLHDDSIEIDAPLDNETVTGKVQFQSFVGVGPRRYVDLFSIGLSTGYAIRRKQKGSSRKAEWTRQEARLRVPMLPTSYIQREALAIREIDQTVERDNESIKTDRRRGKQGVLEVHRKDRQRR